VTFGYFEYIFGVDDGLDREADPINGGKPFGAEGLKLARALSELTWTKREHRVTAGSRAHRRCSRIGAVRGSSLLKKPVDLIMLQAGTHDDEPTQASGCRDINVDWFDFGEWT